MASPVVSNPHMVFWSDKPAPLRLVPQGSRNFPLSGPLAVAVTELQPPETCTKPPTHFSLIGIQYHVLADEEVQVGSWDNEDIEQGRDTARDVHLACSKPQGFALGPTPMLPFTWRSQRRAQGIPSKKPASKADRRTSC